MIGRQLTRTTRRKFRPRVESLEGRKVPALDFNLSGGALSLFQVGTQARPDSVTIIDDGKGGIRVEANFKDGSSVKDFSSFGAVTDVDVDLKGGSDTLRYIL